MKRALHAHAGRASAGLAATPPASPAGAASEGTQPRAASKSSDRLLSLVDATKDGLRRGVDVVVLSGTPHRQITPTWAEDEC